MDPMTFNGTAGAAFAFELPPPPPPPPASYGHIARLLHERPWAIQPHVLGVMADLLNFRQSGGRFTSDEIEVRLAAARSQNGDRRGGVKAGNVAVIPMYGMLAQRASLLADTSTGGTAIDTMRDALRTALADKSVSAVVFDIDSPGGAVDGIPEFAAELRQARQGAKPIIAQVNTLAASAAYWLASNMSEIVCTPSGEVGSIGVFASHEDVSKAQEMEGVKTTLISAGKYKVESSPYAPLTDEAAGAVQGQVNEFYDMFVSDVARGRKTTIDAIDGGYGQGRTLLAKKALAAGMVDRVATLDQTVERLQSPAAAPSRAAQITAPALAATGLVQTDRAWSARMRRRLRS